MRIAISAGHNVYVNGYFDNGTSGFGRREAAEVKEMVALLIKMLRDKGHIVMDVTPYNQRFRSQRAAHQKRADNINSFKPDLYLDIHLNSGGGTGPETIVYSTTSPAYVWARNITDSISKETRLTNRRGVKVRPELMSVNMQRTPSIIVEGAFMDTKKDMDNITPQVYAEAVANVFPNLKPEQKGEKQMGSKKDIGVIVDGKSKSVEGMFKDNTNYVPIRFLEELGYSVDWDNDKQKVIVKSFNDIKIRLNGEDMVLRGVLKNSQNFIPVRFLEELGYEINWDEQNRVVIIDK